MTSGKCPYCGGDGKKESGRVAATQSHLTFGYIERVYRCRKCAETWSICYPIPPKGSHKGMPSPDEKIIKAGFVEGVKGYAHHVVLSASMPARSAERVPQAPESKEGAAE